MLETFDTLKCIVVVLGALIYFFSPLDLIPDQIPVAGLLDDAAVLLAALPCAIKLYRKLKGEVPPPPSTERPR
jgi:uncharacterized membrane protein YkvA (DUF1232 family)